MEKEIKNEEEEIKAQTKKILRRVFVEAEDVLTELVERIEYKHMQLTQQMIDEFFNGGSGECSAERQERMAELEAKYTKEDLGEYDYNELWMLESKLQLLLWIMGEKDDWRGKVDPYEDYCEKDE